jgi:acetoin utilization protein AcuB
MMRKLTVADYMTVAPYSIGLDQSLRTAERRMREQHIRHLPVLEGGVLHGVVSERDIAIVEALGDVNIDKLTVEEAMSGEPYTVAASAPLARVARAMAEHKYGCAVVLERERVKGILTTTDMLKALADVLEDNGAAQESMAPSQVRAVILAEHVHIRALLDRVDLAAARVLAAGGTDPAMVKSLESSALHLVTALKAHIELENRVLAPALAEEPGFGPTRSERLLREHRSQESELERIKNMVAEGQKPPFALATAVRQLVSALRQDMEIEEVTLLGSNLLRDDDIPEDCLTG